MRKTLAAGLAAITFGGAVAAAAIPATAEARDYHGGYHGGYHGSYGHSYYRGDNGGAALVAGIAGLAIGAALASNSGHRGYYDDGPRIYRYRRGYYDGPRYYRPRAYDGYYAYGGPRSCRTTSYYDDWDGRYMERTRCW